MTPRTAKTVPFTPPAYGPERDALRSRIEATRWPAAIDESGWDLGTDADYLRELAQYWARDFDWPTQSRAFAGFESSQVELDGIGIHVIHARGAVASDSSARPLPLLLNHGWPDSAWRFTKVLPLLVDPAAHGGDAADAFDVIVPEMPGFGWSTAPRDRILDSRAVAGLWGRLMTELGYDRFATAGGDIGSGVSRYLSLDLPERVIACHRTDSGLPRFAGDPSELSEPERAWFTDVAEWAADEGAYAAMHRTKPQTLAVALHDSPVGLAAWIVEKLRSWTDCAGDIESVYTKDDVLTLVTQYWLTGSIGSSMRMYRANGEIGAEQLSRRIDVPCGYSLFPGDILTPPREWLERTSNLVWLDTPAHGGHFAPFEQPEIYAQQLREFFRPYR